MGACASLEDRWTEDALQWCKLSPSVCCLPAAVLVPHTAKLMLEGRKCWLNPTCITTAGWMEAHMSSEESVTVCVHARKWALSRLDLC
jgi:hypothetical protein